MARIVAHASDALTVTEDLRGDLHVQLHDPRKLPLEPSRLTNQPTTNRTYHRADPLDLIREASAGGYPR